MKPESKEAAEERIIDTLIGWKQHADKLATHTAAARVAVFEAKTLEVWIGKYPCFRAWLEMECGITPQWAYELINSAQTIAQIEDAAEKSPALAELAEPGKVEVLRGLPARAVRKLKNISPRKAAKVVLKAIDLTPAGEIPSGRAIEVQIAKITKKPGPRVSADHPVLIALDNEWTLVKRDLGMGDFTPKQLFERFRKAVLGALQ